jgi:hypothetical protein
MTLSHQLLGGGDFQSLIPGYPLGKQGHLHLRQMYMYAGDPMQAAQWYADFTVGSINTNK